MELLSSPLEHCRSALMGNGGVALAALLLAAVALKASRRVPQLTHFMTTTSPPPPPPQPLADQRAIRGDAAHGQDPALRPATTGGAEAGSASFTGGAGSQRVHCAKGCS